MRIRIEVESALGKFILPQGYNPYVQGLINACVPDGIAWPGEDVAGEDARFKLFTFSQLYARTVERIDVTPAEEATEGERVKYQLVLSSPAWFFVSSPSKEFIDGLAQRINSAHDLHLERNLVSAMRVESVDEPVVAGEGLVTWRVRAVSPVTVYRSEGRDSTKTQYYAPGDPKFEQTVLDNAVRKYYAWTQQKAPVEGFSIKCIDHHPHVAIVNFKDTPVRGYTGRFLLTGTPAFLRFLYDTGLGGKNSHGFGMFDIIPEDDGSWRERKAERADSGEQPARPKSTSGTKRPEGPRRPDTAEHRPTERSTRSASSERHDAPARDDHRRPSRPSASSGNQRDRFATRLRPGEPRLDGNAPRKPYAPPGGERSDTGRGEGSRSTTGGYRGAGGSSTPRHEWRHDSPRGPREAGVPDRRSRSTGEEPHRKFVSRYAPDIKPVSKEKASTGSYSIWDGKPKAEMPRFVRPDGTESTGMPRPDERHYGPRRTPSGSNDDKRGPRSPGRAGESHTFGRSADSRGPARSSGSSHGFRKPTGGARPDNRGGSPRGKDSGRPHN
jgi:CRISPR-associated endoribonuclease Cas6